VIVFAIFSFALVGGFTVSGDTGPLLSYLQRAKLRPSRTFNSHSGCKIDYNRG
jgi:hypothetical protein